jgi:hypothetical protein
MSGVKFWIVAVLGVAVVRTGKSSRAYVEFRTAGGRQVQAMIEQGDEAPGPKATVGMTCRSPMTSSRRPTTSATAELPRITPLPI